MLKDYCTSLKTLVESLPSGSTGNCLSSRFPLVTVNIMQNWHNTLNQALIAGNVDLAVWPLGLNIDYNQTARIVSNGLFVSVCRDCRGMYETAISYASQCQDFQRVQVGI